MTTFSHAERLMDEALRIINGNRQHVYGSPQENYRRIALLWTAFLQAHRAISWDSVITPVMAVQMHDLAKLSRLIQTPNHEDTLRDRYGYNACNIALVCKDWVDWPPDEAATRWINERAVP